MTNLNPRTMTRVRLHAVVTSMIRDGRSLKDVRAFLDRPTREGNGRGSVTRIKSAFTLAQRLDKSRDKVPNERFPDRGERRNDFFGRKPAGNTKPEERERVAHFRFHPSAPVMRHRAARQRDENVRDQVVKSVTALAKPLQAVQLLVQWAVHAGTRSRSPRGRITTSTKGRGK